MAKEDTKAPKTPRAPKAAPAASAAGKQSAVGAQQARLQGIYREKIVPDLMKKFGYKSVMQVPRVQKITLNMGVGDATSDKKILESAVGDMIKIAGQKPVVTKSRKSIAAFKLRAGVPIGCMVTLRGMNISISTTAKSDEEARALLAAFRFPFRT